MILSNVKIHEALDDGRLAITPGPSPRFNTVGGPETPYATTTVDLRLGANYSVPKDGGKVIVDLSRPGLMVPTLRTLFDMEPIPGAGYILEPGQFILAQTLESVHLRAPEEFTGDAIGRPPLAARVEGKSSLSRLGLLVHFTAPTIHNGFGPATITLEMICLGKVPLLLKPGVPICQLVIEEVAGNPVRHESQFQHQTTPTGR